MKKRFAAVRLPAPETMAVSPPAAERPAEREADADFAASSNRQLGAMLGLHRALLVEDGTSDVSSAQMTKSDFLAVLDGAVGVAANDELRAVGRSSFGCPWIAHWFRFYGVKSAEHIERAIHKFAPEAASAETASDLVAAVTARIRRGVNRWVGSGEIAGLPDGVSLPRRGDPEWLEWQLGPGEPLDGTTLSRMEGALGANLAGVRVHTDSRAAAFSSTESAAAFAVGEHVAFGAGQFRPGSLAGDVLLAHELSHVLQQRNGDGEGSASTASLEADADGAAAAGMAALFARAKGGASGVVRNAGPRLRGALGVQRCSSSDAFRTRPQTGNYVQFVDGHTLARSSGDRRADPLWVSGASDHAAAYTRNASPRVVARAGLPANMSAAASGTVTVRVKEGTDVRGTQNGLSPAAGAVNLDLRLSNLGGSDAVRAREYSLAWEASLDGANWVPLMTTGPHRIYWLFGPPLTSPLYAMSANKLTTYAAGRTAAQDVASAIRSGMRTIDHLTYSPSDPIDPVPLDIYSNGVGICTDYANTLTHLALSAGLHANAVMFYGGFQTVGKNVWASLGGSYINLVNVRSPNPAFNPPLNPAGWAFNYHAISRIEGVLHDAALDRTGIDAAAVHAGKIIRLVELAATPLAAGNQRVAYTNGIQRRDHVVAVTIRDYGERIDSSAFSEVFPLQIPVGAPSTINVPVHWATVGSSMPPGLALNPLNGLVTGTPTSAGTFSLRIRTFTTGIDKETPATITVNP
jgi:hypothetical protein